MKIKSINSSKAVEILKKMDEEEWRYFVKWLASPWCNSTKKLVEILAVLKKNYQKLDSLKLTREKLFQKIYPGKKFSAGVMDNLLSELNLEAERFLCFQTFGQMENTQKKLLATVLQEKGLENRFLKTNTSATKSLESKSIKTWEDENLLLRLRRQLYHHPNQTWRMNPESTLLSEMDQNLDLTYLLQKATNINEKIFRMRILRDTHFDVEKDIYNWLQLAEGIDLPTINLYRKRFHYTEEKLLHQYFLLKEDFIADFEKLAKSDQQVHLLSLLNDSTHLRRRGLIDLSDTLPLFKLGMSSGILIEKNRLDPLLFVMIVSASNLKRDFEFTRHFAATYSKYLPIEAREDGKNYADAHTANREKDLGQCLKILSENEFSYHYFQFSTKILMLQNYFDLLLDNDSYLTTFKSQTESIEKWLRREKIRSISNREPFINFVKKCRSLMRLYLEPDFDEVAVKAVLDGKMNVQPINWLFEKRDEIIHRRKTGKPLVAK